MRIIIAGGGTGGHLFPALAIADALKKINPTIDIIFCGTEKGIEKDIVPKRGYPLELISTSPIYRGFSLREIISNLKFPFWLWKSFRECKGILYSKEKASAVIGVGGYASFSMVFMAQRLGIKTFIQEQNAYIGLANKFLIRGATEVHLSFEEKIESIAKYKDKCFVLGNPARVPSEEKSDKGYEIFNLDKNKKTLFVFGGSLGARSINNAMKDWVKELIPKYNVIWQVGKNQFTEINSRYTSQRGLYVSEFIRDMEHAYQVTDVVMSRAGASTIAELQNFGVAAVLIPYPFAAANHQVLNARSLEKRHAAIVYLDHEFHLRKEEIFHLLEDDERRIYLQNQIKSLAKPHAAEIIAERILKHVVR